MTSTPRQDDAPSASIPEEARLQVGFRGLIGVPVGDFGYRLGDSLVRLGVVVGVLCEGGGTRHDPYGWTGVCGSLNVQRRQPGTRGSSRFHVDADRADGIGS